MSKAAINMNVLPLTACDGKLVKFSRPKKAAEVYGMICSLRWGQACQVLVPNRNYGYMLLRELRMLAALDGQQLVVVRRSEFEWYYRIKRDGSL